MIRSAFLTTFEAIDKYCTQSLEGFKFLWYSKILISITVFRNFSKHPEKNPDYSNVVTLNQSAYLLHISYYISIIKFIKILLICEQGYWKNFILYAFIFIHKRNIKISYIFIENGKVWKRFYFGEIGAFVLWIEDRCEVIFWLKFCVFLLLRVMVGKLKVERYFIESMYTIKNPVYWPPHSGSRKRKSKNKNNKTIQTSYHNTPQSLQYKFQQIVN